MDTGARLRTETSASRSIRGISRDSVEPLRVDPEGGLLTPSSKPDLGAAEWVKVRGRKLTAQNKKAGEPAGLLILP